MFYIINSSTSSVVLCYEENMFKLQVVEYIFLGLYILW